ncbi:uncharacterized protein LOC120422598 [Culex pipiens pallens]|uniref:uncharacterized protein LOC120422598 n=1 Tax=Culex pipiens pallens TaxID=42434 RepID=UPI001953035E|nr:uncharacterized protein LOC120422598 [Culex pipiens pallens]
MFPVKVELLLYCYAIVASSTSLELFNYVHYVVEHLTSFEPDTQTYVFCDLSSKYSFDGIMHQLLTSPRLDHVTKLLINSSFSTAGQFKWFKTNSETFTDVPNLIVLHVGRNQWRDEEPMFYTLQCFQQNTKVLVLVDYRFRRNFEITSWILSKLLKFNKVVYLDIRKVLVIWTDIDGKLAKVSSHYSDPNKLFQDSTRNLDGRNVTYTWKQHKGVLRSMQLDPVVRWVKETAEYLQGRAQPLKNPCPISAKLFDECYMRHLASGDVDLSIDSVDLAENPQIGDLVINGTIDYQDLDGVSAYNIDVNWLHYMAHVPYLDYYRRQRGYCLLQETLGSGVIGYYTAHRMPLYEQFRQSLDVFEEAGIFAHWRREYFNSRRSPHLSSSNIVHQSWLALNLDDVILAWIALAIGFILGGFVLTLEILERKLLTKKSKVHSAEPSVKGGTDVKLSFQDH